MGQGARYGGRYGTTGAAASIPHATRYGAR